MAITSFKVFGPIAILFLVVTPLFAQAQLDPTPTCQSTQLAPSTPGGPEGGASHFAYVFQVKNSAQLKCKLRGVPPLRLFGTGGKEVKLKICANCGDYIWLSAKPIRTIVLNPEKSAHFLIGFVFGDPPGEICKKIFRMNVSLENDKTPLAFKFPSDGPVCDFNVSAWRAGIYKDQEIK
jgi:hypothetical protein